MAGRAAVLSEEETEANGEGHPCVPLGHQGTYEYAGKTMQMRPHSVRGWGVGGGVAMETAGHNLGGKMQLRLHSVCLGKELTACLLS